MSRVFEGILHVDYGQAYVLTGEMSLPHLRDAFRGQTNGLCGAAVHGALWLITGLYTGEVGFTVDVLDAAPSVDEDEELEHDDEDIVGREITLAEWGGGGYYPIPLPPGCYRVRYCARGTQRGRDCDTLLQGGGKSSKGEGISEERLSLILASLPPGDCGLRVL